MPDAYALTPHERVEIVERRPDALVAEARYAPAGKPPPAHKHPHQDEHFAVLDGGLTVVVDGVRRTLGVGETLDVPRGTAHAMWNADPAVPARVRWTTSPPAGTEAWWAALTSARGDRPLPPVPKLLSLLFAHRAVFRLAPFAGRGR